MKNKSIKGITLIALIITIVILLILVTVIVNIASVNNGLIDKVFEAVNTTNIESAKERIISLLAEYKMVRTTEAKDLIEFLNDKKSNGKIDYVTDLVDGTILIKAYRYKFIINKDTLEILSIDKNEEESIDVRAGLKVGDYIEYEPDINTNSYSKLIQSKTGSYGNDSIVFKQEHLNWQILKINEDGSMDIIGTPISKIVYFSGGLGYNNGVTLMNDLCKTLYSKESEGITARSVNAEDIEYWLTDESKVIRDEYSTYAGGPIYGHTQTYVSSLNRKYPKLYLQEKGAKVDSQLSGLVAGIDKEEGSNSGLGRSEEGILTTNGWVTASYSLTTTQTYFYLSTIDETNFGDGAKALNSSSTYWVASRYVYCFSDRAYFGFRYAGTSYNGASMVDSKKNETFGNYSIRPVVSLNADVQVQISSNATVENNPHIITKY